MRTIEGTETRKETQMHHFHGAPGLFLLAVLTLTLALLGSMGRSRCNHD